MRLLLCLLFLPLCAAPLELDVDAKAALLINADTGAVLFEKNADEILFPASTTKIAIALYVVEKCPERLDEIVEVKREAIASIDPVTKRQSNFRSPPHWLQTDAVHIGLTRGEKIPLRDLVAAMMIRSACDAANVIAQHLGGTIPKFMDMLNEFLQEIGCVGSHFNNPHGCHHPDHFSTARDLALMAKRGMRHPFFASIVGQKRYTCAQTNLVEERKIVTGNGLLKNGRYFYEGAIGVKTGTTDEAGRTLVAAATREGRTLISVVLGCKNSASLYKQSTKLLDAAYDEPLLRQVLLPSGSTDLKCKVAGAWGKLRTRLPGGLCYDFYPSERQKVRASVLWELGALPIEEGERVGQIILRDAVGNEISQTDLFADKTVKPGLFYRFKGLLRSKTKVAYLGASSLVLLFLWRRRPVSRKR